MYKIYCKLRDERNLKDADVVRETKITKSTFSDWKSGRSNQKQDKLQKIADYFGVTLDYLMTGVEKDNTEKYYVNDETVQVAQEIFENKELRALFDVTHDAEPEDLRALHSMALALKRKERGNDDTGC